MLRQREVVMNQINLTSETILINHAAERTQIVLAAAGTLEIAEDFDDHSRVLGTSRARWNRKGRSWLGCRGGLRGGFGGGRVRCGVGLGDRQGGNQEKRQTL